LTVVENELVFETERLVVRVAKAADAEFYLRLWTNPRVMSNVGFPNGLPITLDDITKQIAAGGPTVYKQLLVVEATAGRHTIGECRMHAPDAEGIARTDVKLLPDYWGHKYGVEIKRGLLDYLFTHTKCSAVDATPSAGNVASIRMQEAVGGVQIGEEIYEFPEKMRSYTTPVHTLTYRVTRETWLERAEKAG